MSETQAERVPKRPHGRRPMMARRVAELHRASTPLELLYDLTIVIAFSLAGGQFAHAVATGHIASGVTAFLFAVFAIVWAWLNYTWFASAFDNDDWVMRLATLLQMVGVVVLALGLESLFRGFETWQLHNTTMVLGYVTMRVSMIFLWLRAARANPAQRASLPRLAAMVTLAQIGWVVTALVPMAWSVRLPLLVALYALELGGVRYSERRGPGTPWHPHHVAERYSLLVIITLGEVVLGTTTAVDAVVSEQKEWTLDAILVIAAGLSLAFAMWWSYFGVRFGEALELRPDRGFGFGYGHIPLYAAIAAVGAGLHVAAYYLEHESTLTEKETVLAIAMPVFAFIVVLFWLAHWCLPGRDLFHVVLLVLTSALVLGTVLLADGGVPVSVCLVVLMLAPWVLVVGYETRGHGHMDRVLARMRDE